MKGGRWFTIVTVLFVVGFLMEGGWQAYWAQRTSELLVSESEYLKRTSQTSALETARDQFVTSAVVNGTLAIVTAFSVYALHRRRNWAWPLWLVITTGLAAFSLSAIASEPSRWFDHLFPPALCFLSWLVWRHEVKGHASAP